MCRSVTARVETLAKKQDALQQSDFSNSLVAGGGSGLLSVRVLLLRHTGRPRRAVGCYFQLRREMVQ